MAGLRLERTAPNVAGVTREFSATPDQVFEAHVNPDLLRQWLVGPEGWTMTECINDARRRGDPLCLARGGKRTWLSPDRSLPCD